VPEGYARLPGAGYAALHPDVEGLNPEDYPDIHKMAILADVAPYSREYNIYRQRIGKEAQGNTELEIEYEKILKRVKQTRESVIRMQDRHFTAPVDEISGTVDQVSDGGITLNEYPGRLFQFSSVSTSAADMSARILGENNQVSSSFRNQNTSRARARLQRHPRSGLITSWLSRWWVTVSRIASTEMRILLPSSGTASSIGLSILPQPKDLARAGQPEAAHPWIQASTLLAPPALFKESKFEWSLRPAESKTNSRARWTNGPIHDPASPRPGCFTLFRGDG
jgi:hypothetical protein